MIDEKVKLYNLIEQHLIQDEQPSVFLERLLEEEHFKTFPFNMLGNLVNTPQSPQHHPEGSVWHHTMLVVDEAAKVSKKSVNKSVFMWAALLHDIGKAPTTKLRKGKITSYDHDKKGEEMAISFLESLSLDEDFIHKVSKLVRWHMQTLFVVKGMPFADIKNMLNEVSLEEISLLSLCDRLGRGAMSKGKIEEEKLNIERFVTICSNHVKNAVEKSIQK